MEIVETKAKDSASYDLWIQETISDLLEDDDPQFQNSEVKTTRKEEIKDIIKEPRKSQHFLAEEFQYLQFAQKDLEVSESTTPSNNSSVKNMESLGNKTLNDSNLENRFSDNFLTENGNIFKPKNGCLDGLRFKFSKLVEENTQLQVELIRRNSEKRETIIKLQNQVRKLKNENDNLKSTLSYFNRNIEHIRDDSPRKMLLIDRFFRGCSP